MENLNGWDCKRSILSEQLRGGNRQLPSFLCFCFVLNSLRVLEEEPPRPSVGLALPTEQRKRTAGADEKAEDSYATLL